MNILPVSFWGGWAAVITAAGLLFLLWLAVGVYCAHRTNPPPQVWDDNLSEGNAEPPKWYFLALLGFLIFSAAYIVLYPGFGDNTGILKWNQLKQLDEAIQYYEQRTEKTHQRWAAMSLDELSQDKSAMDSARRVFASNCAACHGDNAAGQAGLFPSLSDDEWHWGNSEAQILHTLQQGRVGVMPGWSASIDDDNIGQLADFIIALNNGSAAEDEHTQARQVYAANCVACHGANGEGNVLLGAPRFSNHTWMYNDEATLHDSIVKTIKQGRTGVMPAQGARLTEVQIRLLAAWLKGGMALAPAAQ